MRMIGEAGEVRVRRAILLLIYFIAACLCRCHGPLVLLTDKGYADLLLPCINLTAPKISGNPHRITSSPFLSISPRLLYAMSLKPPVYHRDMVWQKVGGRGTISFTFLSDLITWH